MEERFAIILAGKKIATVHLDRARRGRVQARIAPLPAFRAVARHRDALALVEQRELNEEDPTPAEVAAAEGAQAVLDSLRLSLVTDPGGASVRTQKIRMLQGEPPRIAIEW